MPRSRMARSVRYFRHGRSTWRHIFRTCRHRVTPNTRPTTGGSLNDNLARVCVSLSPFSHFFFSFLCAADGDECHRALRENVSTMYEVFRDAIGNRLYTSLRASFRALLRVRAMICIAENLGGGFRTKTVTLDRATRVTRLIHMGYLRQPAFFVLASASRNAQHPV